MKLVSRTSERTLWRKGSKQPYYQPWTNWEVCKGATNLTHAECVELIRNWADTDTVERLGDNYFRVTDPYCREEYQIVDDSLQFIDGKFIG